MIKVEKQSQSLSSAVLRRVQKELASFASDPIQGIDVNFDEADITTVHAVFAGPEDTPFEGGRFSVRIFLGKDFPELPPKAYFNTKIFHPNVDPKSGAICVNTLKKDWQPELGIRHILLVIRCLMIQPNPASALNEEAGLLLQNNYEEYLLHARLITDVHARPYQSLLSNQGVQSTANSSVPAKKTVNKSSKMLRRL